MKKCLIAQLIFPPNGKVIELEKIQDLKQQWNNQEDYQHFKRYPKILNFDYEGQLSYLSYVQ